jgi:hypothetical protein
MTTPFLVCAAVTAISAIVSLGFSIAAVSAETGRARTMALYACARSVALAIFSFVPFLTGSRGWLLAMAACMIVVQAGDAGVGATIGDRMKTYGPAATAIVNGIAVLWFLRSVGAG